MSDVDNRPPCPGNPRDFVWVRTRNGGHWRHKRGTYKKAVLNHVLSTNARLTKHTNDAASRLMNHLRPHLEGMQPGRSYVHVAGRLKQAYKQNGAFDFSKLLDFDFQKECPLRAFLDLNANIAENGNRVQLDVPVSRRMLNVAGQDITQLRFQLILVYGDVTQDGGLNDSMHESDLLSVDDQEQCCSLSVELPEAQPWMLLLRLSCLHNDGSDALRQRHGMRVIRVGGSAPAGSQRIDLD
ncbi:MAG TPA: hypothetical protein VF145_06305 [Chitinophagaceae bacterium]